MKQWAVSSMLWHGFWYREAVVIVAGDAASRGGGFDGLVEQAVDVSWHRRWDLAMGGESRDALDGSPSHHVAAQHLRLGRARRLTRRDGVVHEIPVGDSGLLETWMISLGHERAVREIVDVWLVTNELDVGVNQRVQLLRWVITGHRGEKGALVPEVHVRSAGRPANSQRLSPESISSGTDIIVNHRYIEGAVMASTTVSKAEVAAALFHGFSERTRISILLSLLDGERRVVDLVAELGISQSNVSGHLACLKDCGLVTDRPEGRQTFYGIASKEVVGVLRAAEELLAVNGQAIEMCPRYGTKRRSVGADL